MTCLTLMRSHAANAAVLVAFFLSCGLPAAAQTTRVPVEGTVVDCAVLPAVPKTAFVVRCLDLFIGTVSADPRVNGYFGFLVCKNMARVRCPELVQTTIKDSHEPLFDEQAADLYVPRQLFHG